MQYLHLIEMFEEYVLKQPERTILIHKNKKTSYLELNKEANKIMFDLKKIKIDSKDCVIIMVSKSIQLFACVLAVQKLEAIFVPVNSNIEENKLKIIEKECNAKAIIKIINNKEEHSDMKAYEIKTCTSYQKNNDTLKKTNKTITYIMYQTIKKGQSKGICISEQSILNMINNVYEIFYENEVGITPFFIEDCFGIFLSTFYVPLCYGGTIVIYDNLQETLMQKEYTFRVLKVTSTQLNNFFEECNRLDDNNKEIYKKILKGKVKTFEICDGMLNRIIIENIKDYFGKDINCYNEYGFVETMNPATYSMIDDVYNITIGKPIKNMRVYVIGSEICIVGLGVAECYVNDEELSNEKFVINKQHLEKGRMFKTGDMGRYKYDGNIEYIGKKEEQINIEGNKIELSEIENFLMDIKYIEQAVALQKNDEIWVYIKELSYLSETKIKGILSENMPVYSALMKIFIVDNFKTKKDGKIDKETLLSMCNETMPIEQLPKNELQKELIKLYEKILCVKYIGIKENFFELGGQSVKVISLINSIEELYDIRLHVKDVFYKPTVEELSYYIEKLLETENNKKSNVDKSNKEFIDNWYNDVSYQQNKILALMRLNKFNTNNKMLYNIENYVYLEETLETETIKNILGKIVQRHEILRTTFHNKGGKYLQRIHTKGIVKLGKMEDFDYETLPLFSVGVDNNCMTLYSNRLIFDEKSVNIFMEEFIQLYKGKKLPDVKYQYRDYVNDYPREKVILEKRYWNKVFEDGMPDMEWKIKQRTNTKKDKFADKTIKRFWSGEIVQKLISLKEQSKTTLHMVLLSVCSIMLYKYTLQKDIVIGSLVLNRMSKHTENMIGAFQNVLLFRLQPSNEMLCRDYLQNTKDKLLEGYEYQNFISEHLSKCKFSLLLNEDITAKISEENRYFNVLELGMLIKKRKRGYNVYFVYNDNVFEYRIIEKMFDHLEEIIKRIDVTKNQKISDIDMLTYAEKAKFYYNHKLFLHDFDKTQTFCDLFKISVKKNASKTALIYKDISITYSILDWITDNIAKKLLESGYRNGDIGAVILEPSIEVFIAIISILKAGVAYLPIEIDLPKERIDYIIKQSNAKFIITKEIFVDKLSFIDKNTHIYYINNDDYIEYEKDFNTDDIVTEDLNVTINKSDLAYVMYTSGSAGKPKGVMVEHHSLTNVILWATRYYNLTSDDKITTYMNLAFDALIEEMFPSLIAGASIYIIPKEIKKNIYSLVEFLETNKITVAIFPTTICGQIINTYEVNLRKIITGGDKLKIYNEKYNISNNYGTTENTVVVTAFEVDKYYENIPIGKPIDNTLVYVVDENMMLVPVGVTGELLVGGEGVARGYIGDNKLTNKYFVKNPFSEGKVYKTGDLVRWREDGNLEFVGRNDGQVKINGYRIELNELESALEAMDEVSAAVVLNKESAIGEKYLCAYVTTTTWDSIYIVKNKMLSMLPEYIFPQKVIELEKFVLNENGKIDKEYLKKLNDNIYDEYVAPNSNEEKKLEEVFKHILDIDKASITDGFYQIGGDSVKAMYAVNKLFYEGYEISVDEFIKESTIEKIAKKMRKINSEELIYEDINMEVTGTCMLTPLQKKFLMSSPKDKNHFNSSKMIYSKNGFEKNRLEHSVNELIKHHDCLRSVFENNIQKIVPFGEKKHFNIMEYDCNIDIVETEVDIVEKYISDKCTLLQKNMNIEEGLLMQLGIFHTLNGDYLMISIHRLVIDETSWPIVLVDLFCGCANKKKTASYIEWSNLLQEYMHSNMIEREKKYWNDFTKKAIMIGEDDLKNHDNTTKHIFVKKEISFEIDEIHTKALIDDINKKYDTCIREVLLAAFGSALKEWNNKDENIIMIEGHGRETLHRFLDVSRTVGSFSSVYPILLSKDDNVTASILKVKEMLKKIPTNGVGYMLLNIELHPSILFSYRGILKNQNVKYNCGEEISKENIAFENTIIMMVIEDNILKTTISYVDDEKSSSQQKIQNLSNIYKKWIEDFIETCQNYKIK